MKSLTVDEAVEALKQGKLVILPTETVYGLAADGLNDEAVKLLYAVKNRSIKKPVMLQVADLNMIKEISFEIPDFARRLINKYWPGPVSIVLKKRPGISSILSAGDDTIGVRMPAHKLTLEIIQKVGRPLAVPSANISGQESPKSVKQAVEGLKGLPIAGYVEGGVCQFGIESTVIDCSNEKWEIIREGAVLKKEIELLLD